MGDEPRDGAARSVRSAETFGANFSSFLTVSSIFNSRRFALTEPIKEKNVSFYFLQPKKKVFFFRNHLSMSRPNTWAGNNDRGFLTWVDGESGGRDDSVAHAVLGHALVLGVVLARFGRVDPQHRHGRLRDHQVARRLRRHLKRARFGYILSCAAPLIR